MARTPNPSTKKSGIIKLSLTEADFAKLQALAAVDGKRAAVIAREVVLEYLSRRADEIVAAQVDKVGGAK